MITSGHYAIGYCRISSLDQSKYSLEHQEASIRSYCEKNSLSLLAIFTDNGECSDTFNRPDYKALETFIKKHKNKVRYLIIMSHDRFSRNLGEALIKINDLQERFHLKVLATNEDINIDVQDPLAFTQRAFAYLMANQELLQIRKRTKDNTRYARLSGRYVSNAPFGYLNARDHNNKGILLIDDEKAAIIRSIFKYFLEGRTIKEVQAIAKQLGFKQTGNSAIQRILSNPVYAGMIKVPATAKQTERYVKGLHQPIITESDFWLAREKLRSKKPSKSQPKEEFPLRGVLKCHCGRNMTAGFSKGRNKHYVYYYCLDHKINYRGDKLHQQFEQLLATFQFTDVQIKKLANNTELLLHKSLQDQRDIIDSRNKQLAEVEKKIRNLDELLLNREINPAIYERLFRQLEEDKKVLISSRQESYNESSKWIELSEFLSELSSIYEIYKKAALYEKHALIRKLFQPYLEFKDGVFRTATLNPAFNHIPSKLDLIVGYESI